MCSQVTIFLVVLCGLVYILWMYPFERYMKIDKSYVRNRNCLEGCTTKSYVAKEALEFCTEYMSNRCTVGCWCHLDISKTCQLRSHYLVENRCKLIQNLIDQAHLYVLYDTRKVEPYTR